MRNPTVRSPSSSSRASTSSIRASESASRSSANESPSLIADGLDLEDVGQAVADQLEDVLAVQRALLDVGLGGHDLLRPAWGVSPTSRGADWILPAVMRPRRDAVALSEFHAPRFAVRRRLKRVDGRRIADRRPPTRSPLDHLGRTRTAFTTAVPTTSRG